MYADKFKAKPFGKNKTKESYSYPYKNIRRMICTCGYEGICLQEVCKKCRKKTTVQINEMLHKTRSVSSLNELTGLTKNEQMIQATLTVRKPFKNANKHYFIERTDIHLRHDLQTGETFANGENLTYRLREKKVKSKPEIALPPIDYPAFHGFGRRHLMDAHLIDLLLHPYGTSGKDNLDANNKEALMRHYLNEGKDALAPFFELCANARNLRYTDIGKLLNEANALDKIIVLLRLPVLEYAEELTIDRLSLKIAESLSQAKNGTDVWRILMGHNGKKAKKQALRDTNHLNHMMRWGHFLKEQENLMKVAATFQFQEESFHPYSLSLPQETELFDTLDSQQHDFEKGIELIASTHPNETVWVNRLVQFKTNTNRGTKSEQEVYQYICDIGNMHEQVQNEFPDFTLRKKHSIKAIHNELVAWFRKVKVPDVAFPYTEAMKQLEGDGFVFVKSSHELVDIGVEMDICVGSYWRSVNIGYRSIFVLKEKNEPKVCIELSSNSAIVQAKMVKNEHPSKTYQKKIKEWAKKHNLPIRTNDIDTDSETTFNPRHFFFNMV